MIPQMLLQVTPAQGEAIVIATVMLSVAGGAGRAGSNVGWLAFGLTMCMTMLYLIGLVDITVLFMIYAIMGVLIALTNVVSVRYG